MDVYIPVVYADAYVDKRGSVISEGHIQNGHFSTNLPETSTFYANSGTFLMFFAVRNTANTENTEE